MDKETSAAIYRKMANRTDVESVISYYNDHPRHINQYLDGGSVPETPLCVSAGVGDIDLMVYILTFIDIDLNKGGEDNNGKYTAMAKAVKNGHLDCVDYLLANGCDINESFGTSNFPLYLAVQCKQARILQFLVMFPEIDLNQRGERGTARDLALRMGLDEYVKIIDDAEESSRKQIILSQ